MDEATHCLKFNWNGSGRGNGNGNIKSNGGINRIGIGIGISVWALMAGKCNADSGSIHFHTHLQRKSILFRAHIRASMFILH